MASDQRFTILCFVAVYLPGYRSGGPVRTIANMVDHLGDEFAIHIVTRDRDVLDTQPYQGVVVDGWNRVGKAQVFYASEQTLTLSGVARLLSETPHDLLYLNSFFAFHYTSLPLVARRFGLASKTPCVIAPRGEFSRGAIALKAWKKRPYMMLAKVLGLYSDLQWQASSAFEADDIRREMGKTATRIEIAPDLPPRVVFADSAQSSQSPRKAGPLRILFLSRISPMKNLDFLLDILGRVKSQVEFAIYGPIREPDYWRQCQLLMGKLPENIAVDYCGEVAPIAVLETFAECDLFVLPTRGENFGHVVLEALVAGTAVLISDRTLWQASEDNAVQVLRLEEPEAWVQAIERWAEFNAQQFEQMRSAARGYAKRYLENSGALDQNRALFRGVLEAPRIDASSHR